MNTACGRILLALSLSLPASLVLAADLMLAGGTLPVCTSLSPGQCQEPGGWREDALKAPGFRVDADSIEAWAQTAEARMHPGQLEQIRRLLEALSEAMDKQSNGAVDAAGFRHQFRRQSVDIDGHQVTGEALYAQMSDPAWHMLRDHFQLPPRSPDGRTLREEVRLHDSVNRDSVEIFERFVDIARARNEGEKPLVLVSTASSRDPYDALAFYLQVFEQAGARVKWLPLDAAVRTARDLEDCGNLTRHQAEVLGSYRREHIDPQSHARQQAYCQDAKAGVKLVEKASGLFLNGGDQWLTFQALIDDNGDDAPEMTAIRNRIAAGKLILGGTSAGSAVQSAEAMVTNGSVPTSLLRGAVRHSPPPHPACDRDGTCPEGLRANDLTWHEHGLATFPRGIVDTHFSERQRQFRLVRLLADTGISFGIGIDETTAALITLGSDDEGHAIETIGSGSTWIVDIAHADIADGETFAIGNARLLSIPAGQTWQTGRMMGGEGEDDMDGDMESSCDTFPHGKSFHLLVAALNDDAAEQCFRLPLDEGGSATGRIGRMTVDPGAPMLYRMDLSVDKDSVVLAAAPDRKQQPDAAQGGADKAK